MKVTKDTVTISELENCFGSKGHTVQLKDADPNELQILSKRCPSLSKARLRV